MIQVERKKHEPQKIKWFIVQIKGFDSDLESWCLHLLVPSTYYYGAQDKATHWCLEHGYQLPFQAHARILNAKKLQQFKEIISI